MTKWHLTSSSYQSGVPLQYQQLDLDIGDASASFCKDDIDRTGREDKQNEPFPSPLNRHTKHPFRTTLE